MSLSGHVIASKHKDNDNHDDDNEMVGAECKQKKNSCRHERASDTMMMMIYHKLIIIRFKLNHNYLKPRILYYHTIQFQTEHWLARFTAAKNPVFGKSCFRGRTYFMILPPCTRHVLFNSPFKSYYFSIKLHVLTPLNRRFNTAYTAGPKSVHPCTINLRGEAT